MTETVPVPLEGNRRGRPGKNYVPRILDIHAIVDACDAERVLARRWTLHKARSGIYVKEVGHGGEFLHRFVLELPRWQDSGLVVDHINHDRLNNRRSNLRAVVNVLNLANSGARRNGVYSLYKGVSYDRSRSKWTASITIGGRYRSIGRYATEDQAALAYNQAAFAEWGEHAQLNDVDSAVALPDKRVPTSRHRGVSWITRHQRFRASIRVNGKLRHLGEFLSEDEAALAYNVAAIEAFGERAQVNVVDAGVALPAKRTPSSRHRGVSWVAGSKCWQANIRVHGELRYLGKFADETEAARAYNVAATEVHGNRARLNVVEDA